VPAGRITTESIFSGLNNLAVYTLLRPDFATGFGFTEPEVAALLDRAVGATNFGGSWTRFHSVARNPVISTSRAANSRWNAIGWPTMRAR
jgi:Predicted AAA-ATPase